MSLLGGPSLLAAAAAAAFSVGVWFFARRALARVETERDYHVQQSRLLRGVIEHLGEGVAVADENGQLSLFNAEATRILGIGRVDSGPNQWSQVYGLFLPDRVTPFPAEDLPLARALRGIESRDVEMFVRNAARDEGLFLRVTGTPARDPEGNIRGAVAVFRDISERYRAEAELRDSEARFRQIVETTSIALVILDADRRIRQFNPEATRLFGLSSQEDVGRPFLERCLPQSLRREVGDDLDRVASGEASADRETAVPTGGGGLRTLLWSFSRRTNSRGQVEVLVATAHDITARHEAEEARRVRELAAHLQSGREEERKRLAVEIHDELGQALTGLKLEVTVLSRRIARESPELCSKLMELSGLIDDTIRQVRRITSDLRPHELDQLGLVEAIRFLAQEFEKRSGILCVVDLPGATLQLTDRESIAVFRILQESLTNVARHARASRVDIRLLRREDRWHLEVEDDGRGIERAEMDDRRSFGLMGMQERARMLGGRLHVGPGTRGGTAVRLELPT